MLGDELDIYDDLDDFQQVEEQKSKELLAAEQKYVDAQKEIAGLQSQNKALSKKIKTMEVNFQNLIDTAKAEIKRKDAMITQLRKEKDDICFRRKRPKWDETAPQQTPKPNSNQLAIEKIENREPAAKHLALSEPQSIEEQPMARRKPALTETRARPPSRSPKRKEASKSQQHFSKNERHKNRDRDRSRERQRSRERSRNKERKERDGSRHRSHEPRNNKQRKQLNSSPDGASRSRQRSSKSSDSEHHVRKSREPYQKPSTDVNCKKESLPNNDMFDLVVGQTHSLIAFDTDRSNCNLNTKVHPMLENERQRSRERSRNKEPKERDGSRHNLHLRSREPRDNKQRKQLNCSPDSSRNSKRSASRSRQRSSKSSDSKHRKSREHYQMPSTDVNCKKESLPNNEMLLFGQTPVSSQIASNSDSSNCNLNTKALLENDVTSFNPSERYTPKWQQQLTEGPAKQEQVCGDTGEQDDTYFVSNTVESVMVSSTRVITIIEPIPGEVGSHYEMEQIDCLYQIPGLDLINGSTELQLAANYQPEGEKAYQVSAEISDVHNIKSETKCIERTKQVQDNDSFKKGTGNDSQKRQKELPNEIGLNDVDKIKEIINETDDKNDKNAFETDKSNDSPKDQKSLPNKSDIHDADTTEINIKQIIETDNDKDSQKEQKIFPTEIDIYGTEMVKGIGNKIEIDKGYNSPKSQKVIVEYVKGVINTNELNAKDVIETEKTTFVPKVDDIKTDKDHKSSKHQKVDAENVKGAVKTKDVIETDKTNLAPKVDDTDNVKGIVFGTEINIKDFVEIDDGNDIRREQNARSNAFEQRLKKIINSVLGTTETNVKKVNETNKDNNSPKLLQKDAENVKEIVISSELNGNDVIERDKATLSLKANETDTFKGVGNTAEIKFKDDNEADKPNDSDDDKKLSPNEIEMHEAESDKGIANVDELNAKEQQFENLNSQNTATNEATAHSTQNPSVEMVLSTNCGESKPVEGIQIIEDIRLPPIRDIECIAMQVDVLRDKELKDPVAKITKTTSKKQGLKKCVHKKTTVPDNDTNVKKPKYEESNKKHNKLVANIIVAQPDSTEAGPHIEDCDASLEAAMNELTSEPDKSAQPLLEPCNKSESKNVSLVQTLSPPDEATVTSTCTKVPKKIVPNTSQTETMPAAATPAKLKKKERSAEYAAELARHSPVKMRIKISTAKNALETTNELEKTPLKKRRINLSDKQVEACVPATPATATPTSVLPAEEMNVTIDETAAERSISLELADDNAMSEYDNSASSNSIVTKRCSLGNSDYQYELVNNNVVLRVKRRGNGSRKQRDGN